MLSGERGVMRITNAPHRRLGPGLDEALRVSERAVLTATIAVIKQTIGPDGLLA